MSFNKFNFKIYDILGVNVFFVNYSEILDSIFNSSLKTFSCVNQYYVNLAFEDKNYKSNLNSFDLIHPDGIGIIFAKNILYKNSIPFSRVNGSDLYFRIIEEAYNKKKKMYFLGDSEKVINNAVKEIKKIIPELEISGYDHGYIDLDDYKIIEKINSTNSFILFVGLGAKRQEYWTIKWKDQLNVEKIINIGGGFRVISKDRLRGPVLLRKFGLEWLVRLIEEPKKYWRRYLIGIPLFLYRVIKFKFQR